jgi:hypothetical protein
METEENENLDSDQTDDLEPIRKAGQIFYLLQNNITKDAQSLITHLINTARRYYPQSQRQKEWSSLLDNLRLAIIDFENDLPGVSEIKLQGLEKNVDELVLKEEKDRQED